MLQFFSRSSLMQRWLFHKPNSPDRIKLLKQSIPVEWEKKARTVTLKTETILRERAGQDVDTFTNTLLADVLAEDPDDLTEDEMVKIRASIERGLEAAATGRVRSAEDYKADVMKRRTERQAISRSRE